MDTVNALATQATRWQWQCLQGDPWITPTVPQLRAAGAKTLVVYADPVVYNPSEPTGIRTAVAPSTVQQSWILTDTSGKQISRTNNSGEYMLDVGNPDYQAAAVAFLVAKCRTAGWDGVMLDEVNQDPASSYPVRPAKYPTNASWQAAQLAFVTAVASGLKAAGLHCWINYGGAYDTWAQAVTSVCDGACSQYWIGTSGSSTPTATVANGTWLTDVAWAQWCEQNGKQSIFHCSTADPSVAMYGLASYLLLSSGHGVFCAAVNDVLDDIYPTGFADALKLGTPLGPYAVNNGIYTRQFQHGVVTVDINQTTGTITLT